MWITINRADLDQFKRSWPCHGLPDTLDKLSFEFDARGDLVSVEMIDGNGVEMDSAEFDGSALVALSQDAQERLQPASVEQFYEAQTQA